jgi:4a-hydroxytetrahydrobiopterin dehydratase
VSGVEEEVMIDLTAKHCAPCEGGVDPLSGEQVGEMLEKVQGWETDSESKKIARDFKFGNFYQTMAFVNAVAWMAHIEDHHPDLEVGYDHCKVHYTTHAIGGLSENDFICAAKINALVAEAEGSAQACKV